jgi:AraC-like DNA-binding protein
LEYVNLKVRIGVLLFDILLDKTLLPIQVVKAQTIHNHSVYEIHRIMSGAGTLLINDKEIPVQEGHLYIIGPTVYHSLKPQEGTTLIHSSIRFAFQDTSKPEHWFPRNESEELKKALSKSSFHQFPDGAELAVMWNLLNDIQTEVSCPSLGAYANLQGLFVQLIVQLARSLSSEDGNEQDLQPLPSKVKDDLRGKIVDEFFTRHFKDAPTLETLATELNLSVKQVNRLLLERYRTTFKQKLLDTRVEEAKALLRTSDMSIHSIAEEIGYSTSDNLCRVFIKRVGMTPTEFRRTYKQNQGAPASDR